MFKMKKKESTFIAFKRYEIFSPIFFLGIIVFLSIPFQLYKNNITEIGDPRLFFLTTFLLFLSFCFSTFLIAGFFIKNKYLAPILNAFFFCGLFFIIKDFISPLNIGPLINGMETPLEPVNSQILEYLIGIIFLLLCFKANAKFICKFAAGACFGLIIVEAITIMPSVPINKSAYSTSVTGGQQLDFKGNIYHFTFDCYSAGLFLYSMQEMGLQDSFNDFVYFPNAKNNYLSTKVSVASYTTGRLFKGKVPLKQWLAETREHTVTTKLASVGITTTFYSPYDNNWYFDADHVICSPTSLAHLFDLCLLRLVPTSLRQEFFHDGKGVVSKVLNHFSPSPTGDIRSYRSYMQFQQLLESEPFRKQTGEYVHGHFMLPHKPLLMTRSGEYDPENSSYIEQVLLSTKLMADLIAKLKELDRFDSSLIILQSDHGNGLVSSLSPRNIERTQPLLLIKPPNMKTNRLVVKKELVQLVDIPSTIYSMIGLGEKSSPGTIMPSRQEVSVHRVFVRRDGKKKMTFGRDFSLGTMDWYTITADGKIANKLPLGVCWSMN